MGWLTNLGIGVGGSILGNYLGGKVANSAMQLTPQEQQAWTGGTTAATALGRQGAGLTSMGLPSIASAGNYWDTLLRGSRSAMATATAGPRAAITDEYRGAERGLERSGVRGGVADLARAELSRDRAGKIAGLTTGVQPQAAQQLGSLGTTLTGQGTAAQIGAGDTWSGLLNAAARNKALGQAAGNQFAGGFGSILGDVLLGKSITDATGTTAGGSWWQKLLGIGGGGNPGNGSNTNTLWDPWYGYLMQTTEPGGGSQAGGPSHTPPK